MTLSSDLDAIRYPIGPFTAPDSVSSAQLQAWIEEIEQLPATLRAVVSGLSEEQFDTPYRPGGWQVRQVVHHLADSHLNSFVRFRWALTEDRPTIKAYYEDRWAELPDYGHPVDGSLRLIEALHARWVAFLRTLSADDLAREFIHPESGVVRLAENVGIYAWHGKHHVAHIRIAAQAAS